MDAEREIDTILLACTHYPLLINKIEEFLPESIKVVSQGKIVAESLEDYLERHPEVKEKCSTNSNLQFYTTDSTTDFDQHSKIGVG